MSHARPGVRPAVPHFSSGPCAKRPGWNLSALTDAVLGRSHRAKIGRAKLKRAIDLTREVLEVPADYRIGIVPVICLPFQIGAPRWGGVSRGRR